MFIIRGKKNDTTKKPTNTGGNRNDPSNVFGGAVNAKSFTITGKVVDDDGEPVGKAKVDILLDGDSQLKKPIETHKKKGTFTAKLKDFEPGDYTVSVEHGGKGTGSLMISLDQGKKKT